MKKRIAQVSRKTGETEIELRLALDGRGRAEISTGIGFLDHMLAALARHGGFDLRLECRGDLQVDDHHTVEDCALALGQALDEILGERAGIARFGFAYAPMDEALCRCVVDLSGRPFCLAELGLSPGRLGGLSCQNLPHFFRSFAAAAHCCVHLELLRGENDHHRAEAAFKALALSLRAALARTAGAVPSTKGVLR